MTEGKKVKYWDKLFRTSKGAFLQDKKLPLLLLVIALALLLMQLENITGGGRAEGEVALESEAAVTFLEKNISSSREIEERLGRILAEIEGAGEVKVLVTFIGSSEFKYAYSLDSVKKETMEKDQEGGVREVTERTEKSQLILSRNNQGREEPILLREDYPEVKGVLVVAQGARNPWIKEDITRAVQATLGISAHKVTVLPRRE